MLYSFTLLSVDINLRGIITTSPLPQGSGRWVAGYFAVYPLAEDDLSVMHFSPTSFMGKL